jgi:serine/threonine protein kinase HipA of HipAB toxin-antitoxin module
MPRTYDTPQEPEAPDFPISYDRADHRFSKSQGVWWAGDTSFPTSRQARAHARELQAKRNRRNDALNSTK